jgi:hypothetical protein
MTLDYFTSLLSQVRSGPAAQRLIFIWAGHRTALESYLFGFDIHRCDPVSAYSEAKAGSGDHRQVLNGWLSRVCKEYEDDRKEPSVLLTDQALLLIRYGCDMSAYFRHVISPRSAAILIVPNPSHRQLPLRAEAWVKNNTPALLTQLANQLGEPDCLIQT